MKRCQNCNDFALYDDNIMTCPVCDSKLITYVRKSRSTSAEEEPIRPNRNARTEEPVRLNRNARTEEPVRPNRNTRTEESVRPNTPPAFETRRGGLYHYRGQIIQISSQARLHSRLKKLVNALFLGEPYQFGNTSHQTAIRIEAFHEGRISGRRRDLIFYGDVEGRIYSGDDVTITAKRRGDRYIVTRMYSNETETAVRPAPQIPNAMVWVTFLLLAMLVIGFIVSGLALALLKEVIIIVVTLLIVWEIIKAFFR